MGTEMKFPSTHVHAAICGGCGWSPTMRKMNCVKASAWSVADGTADERGWE